jgi:hypothetical protein
MNHRERERARALVQQGECELDRGEVIDGEFFLREWDEEWDALEAGR